MTTARERGRNLVVFLGEENDPGTLEVTIQPIAAKLGAALYALWAGIVFGQSDQLEVDAENMGRLAVGEENWPIIDEQLRWAEAQEVIHAGFFWNVQGGGIDLVNAMFEQNGATGGYPKAQELLVQRNGHSTAFGLLKTLLSSDEADETPEPDATSGTSTPPGSES